MPATQQRAKDLADYLFPAALEDTLPLDFTEALPLPDVQFIGIGDQVTYERLNDRGEVIMQVGGTVIGVNYTMQTVQLFVRPALRFWVSVEYVSLNGTADTAVFTTVPAA